MPFSSMYIGASGINAHGSWMDVIGNNLANANTIAYKGSQALFGTLMSETLPGGVRYEGGTNAFPSQKGLGVGVSEIRMDISQGSFEPGETATDLAIGGQGYFRVVNGADNTAFYTRAGNFRFDREGLLVDPHGFALQGWMLDQDGAHVGSTTDIRLPMVTETVDGHEIQVVKSDPRATGAITLSVNLDSTSADRTSDPDNPFFSLLGAYDGRSEPPLSTDAAIYQTSIDVYDAEGVKHTLTVSFDRVDVPGDTAGRQYYEFIVSGEPGEDGRAGLAGTSAAGLYMAGTLCFSANGEVVNMSAYTLASGAGEVKDLANWTLADLDAAGHPQLGAAFASAAGTGVAQTISLDLGLSSGTDSWSAPAGSSAAGVGSDAAHLAGLAEASRDAMSVTAYATPSVTILQNQDGYAEGYLRNVHFTQDGLLVGEFTNGVEEALYQVSLYDFNSEYGLRREGGNLFTAGAGAGAVSEGVPDSGGFGSVNGQTLESSNVDMVTEFANMILSQRGFQANSKVITTSDNILNTLIQTKR